MKPFIYGTGIGTALSLVSILGWVSPQTAYATMLGIFAGSVIADQIKSNDK